jgi:glycosyltransferase involved in cell wall biosynthesis
VRVVHAGREPARARGRPGAARATEATSPILVIIPAWNEAECLPVVLDELAAELPEADVRVIDDGSTDETAQVARRAGVGLLRFDRNQGLAAAIAAGYAHAATGGYALCARLDADGQHRARELRGLLEAVESGRCDVAIGSRFAPGGDHDRYRSPLGRRTATNVVRVLVRGALGRSVADPASGMSVANRSALRLLQEPYAGNAPELEALVRLSRAGLRFEEVPVAMRQRYGGRSKLRGRRLLTVAPTLALLVRALARAAVWQVRPVAPPGSSEAEPPAELPPGE